ncbi:Succinyl-CoA--D-citramalate CoA-transferase, partial [Frankliniella fusca]
FKSAATKLYTWSRLAYKLAHGYGITASISLLVPVLVQGKLLLEMWPWFEGPLGVWLGMVLQAATGYPACVPCFLGIAMTTSLCALLSMLCLMLAVQLKEASSLSQVKEGIPNGNYDSRTKNTNLYTVPKECNAEY